MYNDPGRCHQKHASMVQGTSVHIAGNFVSGMLY
jgi:hypothetical protein